MPINHKQKEQTINKVTRKRFTNVNTRSLVDQLFSQEWPHVRHIIMATRFVKFSGVGFSRTTQYTFVLLFPTPKLLPSFGGHSNMGIVDFQAPSKVFKL